VTGRTLPAALALGVGLIAAALHGTTASAAGAVSGAENHHGDARGFSLGPGFAVM